MYKRALITLIILMSFNSVIASGPIGMVYLPRTEYRQEIWFSPYDGGWDVSVWDTHAVAHLDQTAWIDADQFRTVLIGHRDSDFGQQVLGMAVGDEVYVYDGRYEVKYVVSVIYIVHQSNTDPVMPTEYPTLTFITCAEDTDYRVIVEAGKVYQRNQFDGTIMYANY